MREKNHLLTEKTLLRLAEYLTFTYQFGMRLSLASLLVCAFSLLTSCTGTDTKYTNNKTPQQDKPVVRQNLPENFPNAPLILPSAPPPAINAKSAIVVDALTGRPLYQKNADEPRQVASTQKLMTALVVLEAGNLNKQVTIKKEDLNVQPTRINFRPGDVYERGELLQALMVKSCNDIACALGRDIAGSVPQFSEMMNRKARSLGMNKSHFCNPHGLTEPGQYSTARDMARCALMAYRNPILRSFVDSTYATFHFNSGSNLNLKNTNRLLHNISWCTGMKTGTTDAAGRCLIASGGLNGRHAIVVVLGSTTPHIWKDSETLLRWAVGS